MADRARKAQGPVTTWGPFAEHELELLDDCATEAGSSPELARALLAEQVRARATGREGLREAIHQLVAAHASTTLAPEEPA